VNIRSVAGNIRKGIFRLAAVTNSIGILAVAVMVLVTVVDVIGRRIFGSPLLGSLEIVRFMMAMAVFLTIAHAAVHDHHVTCDVLFILFPNKLQIITEKVTMLLSLGLWIILSYQLTLQALDLWRAGESSMLLRIPVYPFAFIAAFGSALLAFVILIQFVNSISLLIREKKAKA
jgi:TRAP-type C4-dicarboxylate transport system permease small subunit